MDTRVNYMGLELAHPIMIGASPLTMDAQSIQSTAAAGASAVVMKSLFEEQIQRDTAFLSSSLLAQENMHAEVYDYLQAQAGMRYGTRDYLETIRRAKASVEIPVIASLNCISTQNWREFAQEAEAAGADALELNIGIIFATAEPTGRQVEEQVLEIVSAARESVKLPLAVKLSSHFSSLKEMVDRIAAIGADSCVLFNRFWTPTIDIEQEDYSFPQGYSTSLELPLVLRGISILADRSASMSLCANTGIHSGADVIRTLLAGAAAVQVVSAPLQHGRTVIEQMLTDMTKWMSRRGYESISEFRGKLSQAHCPERELHSRIQYMEALGTELEQ